MSPIMSLLSTKRHPWAVPGITVVEDVVVVVLVEIDVVLVVVVVGLAR